MTLAKKNIFGFATIAATVTLSAAIFATGCGDSGDTTVNSLNPDKIANAITVNYSSDTEAALKASNAESLRWIITDGSGKQVAIRKTTAQKINYTGTATKANAALAEDNTTSDDTTVEDTPTSATQNDKCYVALSIPSSVFQSMDNVTVSAIFYDANDKVVGFGSNVNDVVWNKDSKTDKRFSGTITDGNFFSEKDAQYSLTASPEFINKGEVTTLAYNVTSGSDSANIIGLVDVEVADDDYYIKPASSGIVGAYEGVNFTQNGGVRVSTKVESNKGNVATRVYVTDRTITGFTLSAPVEFVGTPKVLIPNNTLAKGDVKAADYSLGQKKVKLFKDGQLDKLNCAVRSLPLEIHGIEWSNGEGETPDISIASNFDDFKFEITNKDTKATINQVSVSKDGVLQFEQESIEGSLPVVVKASYTNGTKTISDELNVDASHADVEVGFQYYGSNPGIAGLLGELSKSKDLQLYAMFVTADGSYSEPFEVASSMFSTGKYPQAKLFTKSGSTFTDYANTTIKVAQDSNNEKMYKLTIDENNQDKDVYVRFGKDDAAQKAAFSPYVDVNFAGLTVAPSQTSSGNEDTETGDEP